MRAKLSNRDYEQISAYLDGQLPPHEQRRFEERLRAHPGLQAELDELSRMKTLLRQAPRRRAPRNFTLTPAMVGETGPRRRRGFSLNLFPVLSFSSALATLALAATLLFQLLPGQSFNKSTASAPLAAPAAESRAMQTSPTMAAAAQPAEKTPLQGLATPEGAAGAAADQSQATPPVINWNGPSAGVGGYGGGSGGDGTSGVPYLGALMGPPTASDNSAAKAYGMGGGGSGGVGGPSLIIPPQAAAGLPTATAAPSATTAQPGTEMTGNGPILGVPSKDEGGQIIDQKSIQGFPESGASSNRLPTQAASPTPVNPPAQDTLLGLPRLTFLQILLGALAVVTGAAAFILRRPA